MIKSNLQKWSEEQISRMYPHIKDEEVFAALVGSLMVDVELTAQHFRDVRDEKGRKVDGI